MEREKTKKLKTLIVVIFFYLTFFTELPENESEIQYEPFLLACLM